MAAIDIFSSGSDDLAVFQFDSDPKGFPTANLKLEGENLVVVVHHYNLRNNPRNYNSTLNLFVGKQVKSVVRYFCYFPGMVSNHEPRILLRC